MAWVTAGNIRGPQGIPGDPGSTGATGATGAAGEGIAIAGSVATYADLPTGLGAGNSGDGYLVDADGLLYIWSGTAFPADGSGVAFRGPDGLTGPSGTDGADGETAYQLAVDGGFVGSQSAWLASLVGATGAKGDQGDTGATGTAGAAGAKGDTGDTGATGSTGARGTKWFTGSGAPGAVTGSAAGDIFLDVSTGDVYTLT